MKIVFNLVILVIYFVFDFEFIHTDESDQESVFQTTKENKITPEPLDSNLENNELKLKKTMKEPLSKTDDEVIEREEEAIKLDGLSGAQLKEMRKKAEKFQFQAEVDRMMKLIINSLYTNKEIPIINMLNFAALNFYTQIFLRELISNASDALDKIRFISLTDPSVLGNFPELSIKIKADKINNMLRIIDTGIGMTRDELVKQLGTIAKSGTTEFLSKIEKEKTENISDFIGQFGVGFYSVYLVADSVTVISKNNDDDQYIWESDSSNTFAVTKDPRGNTLGRGTEIVLRLKPSASEYLESENLRSLVRQYSQYLSFPIYLWTSKTSEEKALKKTNEIKADSKNDESATVTDEEPKPDVSPPNRPSVLWDWERINSQKPIWTRKPAEVTEEEYDEFFKTLLKTEDKPLTKIHFNAEGEVSFKSLLYIPLKAPPNLFEREIKDSSIRLYVRRVFITDKIRDIIPKYLSFIIGIVDSDDLPLNVSRETLQQEKLLKVIQKKLVRKALDMIKKLKREQFAKFWKEFRSGIKMGLIEDDTNRNRLTKLIQTYSSKSLTNLTTFAEYVSRMKSQQEEIYYIVEENLEQAKNSPFIEKFLKYDYEVLFFTDTLDEHALHLVEKYEGTKLSNVARGGLFFDKTEGSKSRLNNRKNEFRPLIDFIKADIEPGKEFIENIVLTDRLVSAPMMVVPQDQGWTGNMERLARSQSGKQEESGVIQQHIKVKKNLEINPKHPIIIKLNNLINNHANPRSDPLLINYAQSLLETAIISSGYLVSDVTKYANKVEDILKLNYKDQGNLHDDTNEEDDLKENLANKDNMFEYDEKLAHAVPRDANNYASDESDDFDDVATEPQDPQTNSGNINEKKKTAEETHDDL